GDPKQSIYRFRRADIGVFLDAREAVARAPVHLTANFRSTAPIVEWVNTVIGRLIHPEAGAQPEFVPLQATRTPLAGPGVAVLGADGVPGQRLAGDRRGADGFPGKRLADEWRAVEATEVAATIGAALTEGWMVQGEDGPRRARPG